METKSKRLWFHDLSFFLQNFQRTSSSRELKGNTICIIAIQLWCHQDTSQERTPLVFLQSTPPKHFYPSFQYWRYVYAFVVRYSNINMTQQRTKDDDCAQVANRQIIAVLFFSPYCRRLFCIHIRLHDWRTWSRAMTHNVMQIKLDFWKTIDHFHKWRRILLLRCIYVN